MNSQGITMSYPRTKGIFLVLIAAIFWGVSGTVAQYLFHQQGFSTSWLVVTRLIFSGLGLLFFAHTGAKQNIWIIWKNKKDVLHFIVFGVIGMFGVQFTYFAAIEHGNAASATVLQYLAPVIIACFLCIRSKAMPAKHEMIAIFFALLGTFLLVTKGNIHSLAISGSAFFWGILSAFALAFYTLYPGGLLSRWGSLITVRMGYDDWRPLFQHYPSALGFSRAVVFIILFGCRFCCYFWHINRVFLLYGKSEIYTCFGSKSPRLCRAAISSLFSSSLATRITRTCRMAWYILYYRYNFYFVSNETIN